MEEEGSGVLGHNGGEGEGEGGKLPDHGREGSSFQKLMETCVGGVLSGKATGLGWTGGFGVGLHGSSVSSNRTVALTLID